MKKTLCGFMAVFAMMCLGCDGDSDSNNNDNEPFTLTIEGTMPAAPGGKLYAASLVAPNTTTPLATALGNGGVFEFYEPASNLMPSETPFLTDGDYGLVIVLTNLLNPTSPEKVYMYNGTINFKADDKKKTLPWGDFSSTSEGGYTLTVSGMPTPADGKIYVATLLDESTPVAIGMPIIITGTTGNCAFKIYPILTTPFEKAGTYGLSISLTSMSNLTSPEANYVYMDMTSSPQPSPKTVTYNGQKISNEVNASDFMSQTGPLVTHQP